MASSEKDNNKPQSQPESVRERAERAISEASKPKKKENAESPAKSETKSKVLEPKNKASKSKKDKKQRRFHIIPKFIRQAFVEIRLVTWPDARTTFKLTTAVIIFATVFAILISLVDYGFGKIFKKVFLHG